MPDTYKLVVASGSDNLSDEVNEYLSQGYELYEGHQLSQVYSGVNDKGDPKVRTLLSQAVVKYDDSEV